MAEGRIDVLYLLSTLLGFQLLPQPRLFRCRGRARPGRLGSAALGSTGCRVARSSTCVELVRKETGRMFSAESRDGSLGCAHICRLPPPVQLATEPRTSQLALFRLQTRGVRRAGVG